MANQITPNPSVPSQVVAEVKFPKFINNLGIIPTSYKDSMSYYECLAWLCKFLEEQVIPTVNENGEAVEELQALYVELNSYVTNYFDNLDVQEEINNKLDQMLEDGDLDLIVEKILMNSEYIYAERIGLINDGTTDNTPLLLEYLSNYNNNTLKLYFTSGTYYFKKHESERITLPNYTELKGTDNTIILYDDVSDYEGVSLFNGAVNSLFLNNLYFKSNYDTTQNSTNASFLFYETQTETATNIRIENCKFTDFRNFCMQYSRTNNVIIKDSKYYNISRDSNRFLRANNSLVENCNFEKCGDDIISCHGNESISNHKFINNYIKNSYGCGYLGGKNIEISGNTFELCYFLFKCGYNGSEGGATKTIKFINNVVLQPVNTQYSGRNLTEIYPQTENVYFNNNQFYDGTVDTISSINIGNIHNNVPVRHGLFIIHSPNTVEVHKYLQFNNNIIKTPTGGSNVGYGDSRLIYGNYTDLDMHNNVIEDFYNSIATGSKRNWNITNNFFDGDKQHLLSTDGTFASSNTLRILNPYPENFKNNVIKNISGNYDILSENDIYFSPDGKYMNPIDPNTPCRLIPYDYVNNTIYNNILQSSNTMPNSGYYHLGTFVRKNVYSAGDPIMGWVRLTTGNAHVSGTDWRPVYYKTSAS